MKSAIELVERLHSVLSQKTEYIGSNLEHFFVNSVFNVEISDLFGCTFY
jgi:hypothetical protein